MRGKKVCDLWFYVCKYLVSTFYSFCKSDLTQHPVRIHLSTALLKKETSILSVHLVVYPTKTLWIFELFYLISHPSWSRRGSLPFSGWQPRLYAYRTLLSAQLLHTWLQISRVHGQSRSFKMLTGMHNLHQAKRPPNSTNSPWHPVHKHHK